MGNDKYSNIPNEIIREVGNMTYLIYSFMEKWNFRMLDNIDNFIAKKPELFTEQEKTILLSLKDKYPDGVVSNFITNRADLQCAILKNPHKKRYTLVFRGSESITDWLYDLCIYRYTINKNIKIHYGFYKQLHNNGAFDKIKLSIKTLAYENPEYSWYISGHSLGGALAILSSYLLAKEFREITFTTVSLASPRVGNSSFATDYNNQPNLLHYRICNKKDIVTAIPYIGYDHCGYNILFSGTKWLYHGLTPSVNYNILNFYNPFDHSCTEYIRNLDML